MQECQKYSQRRRPTPLEGLPLAMAYVPWQQWGNLYSPEKGFHQGTIFQDLDFPFNGRGGCRR
ncbi:MAG: spore coat associated protein CotJA [Lachnospiraceae bacterium]|nr:spore coat associated protein CotJA [Lachnospiraceae bacterium]